MCAGACPIAASIRGPESAANNIGKETQATTHKSAQDTLRPCLRNLPYYLQSWQQLSSHGLAALAAPSAGFNAAF